MERHPLTNPRPWDYAYLFARLLLRELRSVLPLPGRLYLDIGAGQQPYRSIYASGRRVVAFDRRKDLPDLSICGQADHLPVRSESSDVVLILATLQLVDDPARVLREISRVLKPGGTVVLADHQSWHSSAEADRYFFKRGAFEHLVRQAGLRLVQLRPLGSFWARVGIRINRMILPYRSSRWSFLGGPAKPLIAVSNAFFGLLDALCQPDGEAIAWLAVASKPDTDAE